MSARSPLPQRLFESFAGGTPPARPFHSGAGLAAQLGLSRSAIWKAVSSLRELGIEIEALPRRGYRLAKPLTLLQADRVAAALPPAIASRLQRGECLWSTDSTNALLLARGQSQPGRFDYVTAEYQTAGRGRRGRTWIAPPGGAICLSWSWSFDVLPSQSGALSLAIGVSALRALDHCGVRGVGLKWPNDLLVDGRKLGGILIELKSESGGPALVVVGIGLNVALSREVSESVAASGTQATDLWTLGANGLDRSALVAALLAAGVDTVLQFSREGLAPFLDEFREADALHGREVVVSGVQETVHGTALGVDTDGALLLATATGQRRFLSGEVSVRHT
ncbi:MAG TPA: biotin--[acetyl-CoA-carboxylase] ligase [Steroidobacteraceae bacterium]|jgi:BirA family biotin operon repressor/biotin-[acetyl-CoA-carboxylase] ligase|nr:biotin--[acetyl-CoA-carboxylase] ligase [Steroidobacteraceae bacterium]